MSTKSNTVATAAGGFPFGTIALVFWLAVHYSVPLGTAWGGMSVHVLAYYAVLLGVIVPAVFVGVILAVVLLILAMIAVTS